jgi:hypothetical protein
MLRLKLVAAQDNAAKLIAGWYWGLQLEQYLPDDV